MTDAELNPTLRRQLRRLRLSEDEPPATPQDWRRLLDRISQAYANNRQDLYLMERSVHMVSQEMQELYTQVQRRADYRVASERDRLRAIISGFSDAYASMDLEGRILTLNPAGETMLGEGACGRQLLELMTFGPSVAVELADQATMCTRVLGGQTIRDEGATILAGTGRRVPVSVLVFPIRQRGEVTGLGATIRDISDRLQAERILRRLGMAVDASADAIYTTDSDGTIEYVNGAFTTITGFGQDEVIGENPRILASGRTPPEVYRGMWAELLAGKAWSGRILNRRKVRIRRGEDRFEEYWAQLTITGYFDGAGVLQGYVALQRDVSEIVRREQRQAAEAFATRLRAETAAELQRQSPLADRLAAVVTLVADSLGRHGDAPAAGFLRLYGARDDADHETRRRMPRRWREHVRWPGDDGYTGDAIVVDSPDARTDLDGHGLLLIPVTHARLVVGCLVVASAGSLRLDPAVLDSCEMIGEMVGLAVAEESAWRAAEDARSAALGAAEAKSKFLANMSHEIRTPMNGVLGMLDMLRHTQLDAKQQDYLSVAHTSAEALLTVINDILDFSKIEAGKVFLEEIPFDARSLAEDVTTLFSASAIRKGIELACYAPSDVPVGVRGDPTRLRQVLANIIGNAVKFTDTGEIVVRVLRAPGDEGSDRVMLRFEVTDTGIGMDGTTIAHLFQPFSQADSSMSRRFGGTGLGLAISHQLVELMGGHIRVASTSGNGTTFWFDLPFPMQPGAENPMRRVDSLSGARVLVVDDNETNRTILAHYLRDWDLVLDTAADGAAALDLMLRAAAAGRPYRVAMIDMLMPGLDGAALAHRIRETPELAETRLVLVTSAGISDDVMRAHGFDYSISKPVRQAVVHDILLEMGGRAPVPRPRTAPLAELRRVGAGRVLLAEDNLVNQRVALGMLDVLGIECDVATDGGEVLSRLADGNYSLVLMDCQMPVMDGFEATRRLRRLEGTAGALPVIAMTAHAMDGDREACLAAGMDDYLPKPFSLQQLSAILTRWLPGAARRGDSAGPAAAGATVLDETTLETLADLLGQSLPELVTVFLAEVPDLLGRIRKAVAADDAEQWRRAAHSLRSSAKVFGAGELADRAADLETCDDEVNCRRVIAAAERSFEAVAEQLRSRTGEVVGQGGA